jgi:hypothetical protein
MKRVLLVLAMLALASPALCQTLPNPTGAEWTASVDHSTISAYEIGWFLGAATSPVSTVDVGKPTPNASNVCSVTINVMPLPFGEYVARVRAKAGTVYSEWSDPSNLFQRVPGKPGGPVVKK